MAHVESSGSFPRKELGKALRIGPKSDSLMSDVSDCLESEVRSLIVSLSGYLFPSNLNSQTSNLPLNPALTQNYENLFSNSFQKLQPAVIYIVEEPEKARGFERKHSIYFQDGHRKCRNGMPKFKKGTAFLPSTFSGKVKNSEY